MGENNHHHDLLNDLNAQHRALRKMIPDVDRGIRGDERRRADLCVLRFPVVTVKSALQMWVPN